MTARLPIPGADQGKWGEILNEYLSQSHAANGTLKDNVVGTAQIRDGAVTSPKISDNNVSTAKLQDASVTEAKLSEEVRLKLSLLEDLPVVYRPRGTSGRLDGQRLNYPGVCGHTSGCYWWRGCIAARGHTHHQSSSPTQ